MKAALASIASAAADLADTRASLIERLRHRPDDQPARMYLFQLLCITREWDSARTQLRLLGRPSDEAHMFAAVYDQAIDAMLFRNAVLTRESEVPLLVPSEPWASAFASAPADEDASRRLDALDAAPDTPGEVDGRAFERLFDVDTRFGPMIEAVVGGRWGLIPFAAIQSISSDGPVDLRDLVWLPAEIRLWNGRRLAALLPTTYPDSAACTDAHRLARRTDWTGEGGAARGIGQHILTMEDGGEAPLLGIRQLSFAAR